MTMRYENPFPGMDPYLEQPHIWPGFHNRLITYLADDLSDRVPSEYRLDIEERTEIATVYGTASGMAFAIPDAVVSGMSGAVAIAPPEEVRVTWLYVQRMPDWKVVTVVEVLSPTNKVAGAGRDNYLRKRGEIFNSGVSLVEIDLLRGGEPMPLEAVPPASHYRILVCRGWERPNAILYPFNISQVIPKFTLPLQPGDAEPEVDLAPIINEIHRRARYAQIARYADPPPGPPLAPDAQQWVDNRLQSRRQTP